ncbi:hypothetical protein BX666DRAFT_1913763 [Dichotomocladium elegans]|nr:hypothetical protein BX666DRAFT_1913763 [Dichotomocladium elegans]
MLCILVCVYVNICICHDTRRERRAIEFSFDKRRKIRVLTTGFSAFETMGLAIECSRTMVQKNFLYCGESSDGETMSVP